MIQRIQTIYLLLAAAALGLQFVLPYAVAPAGSLPDAAFADGVFNPIDRMPLLVGTIVAGVLAAIAIFLFKNRLVQSRLTSLGLFAAAILAVLLTVQFFNIASQAGPLVSNMHYQAGVGLPGLSAVLMWLANRAIRRDEALVRSADRLR